MTKHYILLNSTISPDFGFVFSVVDTDPSVVLIRELAYSDYERKPIWASTRTVFLVETGHFNVNAVVPIARAREIWKSLTTHYAFVPAKESLILPPENAYA